MPCSINVHTLDVWAAHHLRRARMSPRRSIRARFRRRDTNRRLVSTVGRVLLDKWWRSSPVESPECGTMVSRVLDNLGGYRGVPRTTRIHDIDGDGSHKRVSAMAPRGD